MNRILVVNVNWLGDVIFSLPVFKALKTKYPHSHVSCLAPERVKDILEMSAYVDEVIVYEEKGRHQSPWGKLKLIYQLHQNKFDIVFLLHRSLTRALLVFLAGIPQRVGYDTKQRGFLLTHKVPPVNSWLHRSDQYLKVIESFGVNVQDRSCDLQINDFLVQKIEVLLSGYGIGKNDFLVVVHCGGNWDLKRWPKENFAQLIKRLNKEFSAKIVISGGSREVNLAQEVASLSESNPIVLAGKTQIKELLALLKRSNLVISSDSGPLHLASSVQTPVIGLFGPTRPEITGARGLGKFSALQKDVGCNREPCYYLGCPKNVCMHAITVDDVIYEVRKIKNV